MKHYLSAKRLVLSTLACVLFLYAALSCLAADAARIVLPGHVPRVVAGLRASGHLPATNRLSLAIGLPLRNQAELEELIRQLYDPQHANFHKYLTPAEFTARFGPTEADYEAVIRFARGHGLRVAGTHSNRVVLDVEGSVSSVEQALQITLRTYRHPAEKREFFAPDIEPSVPIDVPVNDLWGLSDYAPPRPLSHQVDPAKISPLNYNGTGPSGSYQGRDFRNAYAPDTSLAGSGQIAAVAEFDGYYANDITTYEANSGYTNVPLQNVLVNNVSGTPGYSGQANAVAEVSLDIELLIAMAPGLNKVMVYEGSNPYNVFNKIATDNAARQISCSWAWGTGPSHTWISGHGGRGTTLDSILSQMVAQGQSFFQASGDSDAYTGSQTLSSSRGPIPVDSIYLTSVGGTTLTMSGTGGAWSSETVWNWGSNTGSGGGISPNYSIPSWQASLSMTSNNGSTVNRNIPDVALTADAISVVYNNGTSDIFGGTSCAAPLWAGFTALVNQQAAASGSAPVGFLNPALYNIAASANYTACFHDVTTGNNIGNNTAGLFYAVTNYDLATGLGTPNGANLINALAPPVLPFFISQPASRTVTNGANVTFSASAGGQAPLNYQWLFNGTNLPAGGNVSGAASNVLTLTPVTLANTGNYRLIVTNNYGSATSGVASLTVVFPPAFTTQPANQSVVAGSNAIFSAIVSGALPLAYQWRANGINLVNGGNLSGATSNVLTISAGTSANAGNYTLIVTNIYGSATSSVATLIVLLPPAITFPPAAQAIQCGSNASFTVTATGTAPLKYQWSLDGAAIVGATNTSLSLTNVHPPSHTVAVVVTNLYGSATSSVPLAVQDTLPPVITLMSTNPFYVELGGAYTEPGATAYDLCAGIVPVATNGAVNTSVVGTNTVTYTATDGSGNTGSHTRTVIVRDTTPPIILWSFTNLVLAADAACSATMPAVTETNFILATDLSGALTITQSLSNNIVLPLGTNVVVITVSDGSGNKSYSTNYIIVRDQTPPVLTLNGTDPMINELGAAFTDPGVSVSDNCSGLALVTTNGSVNFNMVGTNLVTYQAADDSGNTSSLTRTVIVLDTTHPAIVWSFTNLVLAADANCSAVMPDVTGTNFILATDLSGALTLTQSPANNAVLPLGTNVVVITAADAFGNAAFSTNTILVLDETPPMVLAQLENQTNTVGASASFSVAATACTPLAFQWFFNDTLLTGQTNSALTLPNLDAAMAGNYFVDVTASGGSTTSAVLTLTVSLPVVTNHPPVVQPAFYTLVAGLNLNIAVADLATNWGDADGDPLFIAAISTSTNGVVVTNALPTLFYSNTNYVDDQFVCTISDGNGGANFQAVNIAVVPQTNATPFIAGVAIQPGGGVNLSLNGGYGLNYVLESRTNLASGIWEPVVTNTPGVTGVWQFTDEPATNCVQRFYRLKLMP